MRIDTQLCCLPAFAFLALAPLHAQTTKPQEPRAKDAGAVQEETMDAAPAFAHVEFGPRAVVNDEQGQALGILKDIVIDRKSGDTLFHVVEVQGDAGAKAVLVPFERFTWSKEKHDFVLRASKTELANLPVFEPEQLQTLRGSGVRAPELKTGDAGGAPRGGTDGAKEPASQDEPRDAAMAKEVRNLLASEVSRAAVGGSNGAFGRITSLLIEQRSGEIAFVLVSNAKEPSDGGEAHVVPWRALTRVEDGRFVIPMTIEELSGAPEISPGDVRSLSKEEILDEIYGYYHVPRPRPAADATLRG